MQATITYLLTEQAQRDAMAATGQPVARKQTTTVEITPQQFKDGLAVKLLNVNADGAVAAELAYDRTVGRRTVPGQVTTVSDDPADYLTARISALQAAQKAHDEDKARALDQLREITRQFLAGTAPAKVEAYRHTGNAPALRGHDIEDAPYSLPEGDPLRDQLDAWMTRKTETECARQVEMAKRFLSDPVARASHIGGGKFGATVYGETLCAVNGGLLSVDQATTLASEAKRRKDADDAAREQAKQDFITAWFADPAHADNDTRKQFSDGLLSRKDALSMIADASFSAVGLTERYAPAICDNRSCACRREDIDSLPRSVYPAYRALKERMPEGAVLETESVRECLRDEDGFVEDGEDATEPRYAVNVKLPVGPFTFERLVRL